MSSSDLKQQGALLFRLGASYLSPWVCMSLAICFELFGTIHAKLCNGMKLQMPTYIMYISYMTSVSFLALALDTSSVRGGGGLDLGVAYATWSGLGTIVAALYGVLQAGETLNTAQWAGLVLTSIGITLVNVAPEWSSSSSCCFQQGYSPYNHGDNRSGGEQEPLLNTTTAASTTYGYYNNDDHEAVGV